MEVTNNVLKPSLEQRRHNQLSPYETWPHQSHTTEVKHGQ